MAEIKWIGCASNNFRRGRPAHLEIEAVVIHLIDGSLSSAGSTFLDNALSDPRSAHYGVGKDGSIHQYVQESDTAYHAGKIVAPTWPEMKKSSSGFINPNFYTIGIEHEGRAADEWTPAMYAASADLLRVISARYPKLATLTRSNVVMHRQIRADKACPGKCDIDQLISLASSAPAPPAPATPGVAIANTNVNVRVGNPTRTADVVRTIPAGALIHFVRKVRGESVTGSDGKPNDEWYETIDGSFIWTGAARPEGGS